MRSLAEVTSALPANADAGLTEAAVAESQRHFGSNVLTPLPRAPLWQKFIDKFAEPIIIILLAAALLSMIVEIFKHDSDPGEPPTLAKPGADRPPPDPKRRRSVRRSGGRRLGGK